MPTAIINIKTDVKVKLQAQKLAADLGISLSAAINGFLYQFVRQRALFLTADESQPTPYLLESVSESLAQIKKGEYVSFKKPKDAIKFLRQK